MSRTSPVPMNVLVLHCHDLGRFLGTYGHHTVRSPHLDRFATESVLFENAYATAPQCSPARASLFTGQYPQRNGVMGLTHQPFDWDLTDPSSHLATKLRGHGYRTELIGVHHESRALDDAEIATRLGFDVVQSYGAGGARSDASAPVVTQRTLDALRSYGRTGEPFYLQVGFFEPHRNPDPDDDDSGVMGFLGGYIEPDASLGVEVPPYMRDDAGARQEIAELQGAVHYLDRHVGDVLTALEEVGLAERTIVVFTTDHGLALPRAKCTLYGPGLAVALMIRVPNRSAWRGVRASGPVSHLDVRPTLIELLGLLPDGDADGVSLVSQIEDGWEDDGRRIFGQLTYHDYYSPRRSIRMATHSLIVNFDNAPTPMDSSQSWFRRSAVRDLKGGGIRTSPLVELYDLQSDPHEEHNLAASLDLRDTMNRLLCELLQWMRQVDDPLLTMTPRSPHHAQALQLLEAAEAPAAPAATAQPSTL